MQARNIITVCFYHVTYSFSVNRHSEVPECQETSDIETGAISEDQMIATGLEPTAA